MNSEQLKEVGAEDILSNPTGECKRDDSPNGKNQLAGSADISPSSSHKVLVTLDARVYRALGRTQKALEYPSMSALMVRAAEAFLISQGWTRKDPSHSPGYLQGQTPGGERPTGPAYPPTRRCNHV